MTSKFAYLLFSTLILMSCQSTSKEKEESQIIPETTKELTANYKWMQAINTNNISLLETLYTEKAFVLSKLGVDLSSRQDILNLVKDSDFKVKDVKTIKKINANDAYDYEIGSFANKHGDLMKHLIIWKNSDSNQLRELEFLAEVEQVQLDLNLITMRRAEWMTLCNAHDAKSLIKSMYTENTMYYNRGRMLEGRDRLIEEYQYMNNPNYNLTLEPILVEPVSNDIVYEFGQCNGSYNGKYILIWQKNGEGIWQILFDSNI